MIRYSQRCNFISKSAYDFNQCTQTGVAKMRVLPYCNKEDIMEVMICCKLYAVIH